MVLSYKTQSGRNTKTATPSGGEFPPPAHQAQCSWTQNKTYENVLWLPEYYSDDMVLQRGPSRHRVWGMTRERGCPVTACETCVDGTGIHKSILSIGIVKYWSGLWLLPMYRSDIMVLQWGPSQHSVWGMNLAKGCLVTVSGPCVNKT